MLLKEQYLQVMLRHQLGSVVVRGIQAVLVRCQDQDHLGHYHVVRAVADLMLASVCSFGDVFTVAREGIFRQLVQRRVSCPGRRPHLFLLPVDLQYHDMCSLPLRALLLPASLLLVVMFHSQRHTDLRLELRPGCSP